MSRLKDKTAAVIGTGNMGSAIIKGLSENAELKKIIAFDADPGRLESLTGTKNIETAASAEEAARASDIIILGVKPPVISSLLKDINSALQNQIVISVAAGVTLQTMKEVTPGTIKLIRAMPNTPALVQQGMTVISPDTSCSDDDITMAREIFSATGRVLVMAESLMDAVTGVSGSGPAYVFTFIQAMADGAVKMGIPRQQALELAAQTVKGAAELVIQSGENPLALRDMVTSPGGTTIEAVHVLEKSGFSGIVMDAIEKAANKSKMLGSKK